MIDVHMADVVWQAGGTDDFLLPSCATVTDFESASQRSDMPLSCINRSGDTGGAKSDAPNRASRDELKQVESSHDEASRLGTAKGSTVPNAPPLPSRAGAGRFPRPSADSTGPGNKTPNLQSSDMTSDTGSPQKTPQELARAKDDKPGSTQEAEGRHEVFILTPDVVRAWAWNTTRGFTLTVGSYYLLCALLIVSYRWVNPPTTDVQLQRSIEAWWNGDDTYETTYLPVPLAAIESNLELAVVAAEDTRFFQHNGIDWEAIGEAIEDNRERGFVYRGGSTITQQLAKNLFQTTHSSFLRKGMEVPLTYLIEIFLSKERILELYLNVIEWGPGVFGVEAAVQHHYGRSADTVTRYRAAALAACIPNPLARTPGRMYQYARTILRRMYQLERIEPQVAR